jgi:phosphinothricin acetyltransferase
MQFEPGDRRRRIPRHLRRPEPAPEAFAFSIRPATAEDLPHVREIYNHYVSNSVVTFDERRSSIRYWREKFATLTKLNLPFLVAVSPADQVLGYALVQPWASKSAYRYTVEDSIYLGPGAGGKGLGSALLQALIDACQQIGLREIVAVISDSGAEASIRLHTKLGFVEVGRMGRVGFKFGRSLGTVYLQRSLKARPRRWGLRRR